MCTCMCTCGGQKQLQVLFFRYHPSYFLIFKNILLFYVDGHLGCTCVPGAHGGLKRASNALELELQMALSGHVGAGT